MVTNMEAEAIAAVSTPYGRGGIAVVRISGEGAVEVAERMFVPKNGRRLSEQGDRRAVFGDIICSGEKTDEGIAVVYRAPASYTGEDTVEISCHGGILLTEKVLSAAFDGGARPARAGEFTQRAFVNGKIDLSGAEAVIGLIDAETDAQLRLSASHAFGVLKDRTEGYREELLSLISSVYVCIDYPDEDLEDIGRDEMLTRLRGALDDMRKTLSTYREGRAVNEGIDAVILGKPNVGKSSVLNRLLGKERAIVTDIAGTTRDVLEERLTVGRVMLRLCDTAGIRQTEDTVERLGIGRAMERAEEAELVLAVFDGSRPLDGEDVRLGESICRMCADGKTKKSLIILINKCDVENVESAHLKDTSGKDIKSGTAFSEKELMETVFSSLCESQRSKTRLLRISAASGEGIEELERTVEELFISGEIDYSSVAVIANARQHSALRAACGSVEAAIAALEGGFGADVCGLDLERAVSQLGEIDGRTVTGEITDRIFHRFCVGK